MDTRQLEIFIAVADERSFTRAARRLFAAQSTVSAAVRALERELGAPLFDRSTRSVELSALGESLLGDARTALDAMEHMRSKATPGGDELRGRLRVGIFSSLEFLDLPAILGRFHRDHPLVTLRLVVSPAGSSGLLDDVRHGRLDIALVGLPTRDLTGLEAAEIGHAEFVAVLPSAHPLAGRDRVAAAELADEAFVDTPVGFGNRVAVDRLFDELGRPRTVIAEVAEMPSVPRFVAEGLGIAVIPRLVEDAVAGTVIVPIDSSPDWTLSVIANHRHSPAATALLDRLRAEGDQTIPR